MICIAICNAHLHGVHDKLYIGRAAYRVVHQAVDLCVRIYDLLIVSKSWIPQPTFKTVVLGHIYILDQGGSVAEWLACWTQAQKGLGSNRSRDAVG